MLFSGNFLSIVLGTVYLGLIAGLIWWMLGIVPGRQEVEWVWPKRNSVVVSLTGSKGSRQALDLGCQLACERHAGLVLAHVVVIPMTLGLDVSLDAAEEHGRLLLQEGEKVASEFDLPVESYLLRHRSTVLGVCELAREIGAKTIVLEDGVRSWWSLARLERDVELRRHAPCEVLFANASIAA